MIYGSWLTLFLVIASRNVTSISGAITGDRSSNLVSREDVTKYQQLPLPTDLERKLFFQLIMDRSAPSLGLVPINRLLASTINTLPLVWELIPMYHVALWAVIHRWYAQACIPAVREKWTPPMFFFSPGTFVLPVLLLLLPMPVLVDQHLGHHMSVGSFGIVSSLVSTSSI